VELRLHEHSEALVELRLHEHSEALVELRPWLSFCAYAKFDLEINRPQKTWPFGQTAVGTPGHRALSVDRTIAETGMASQLASAWPRKLAAHVGGFDRASDDL